MAVAVKMKRDFRIIRTLPLDRVASQMAEDVTGAIYSAVQNKARSGLREGEDLEEVVDQYLEQTGFAEIQQRIASTRIEVKIGIDVSSSMFGRPAGSTIVKAVTAARLFRNAFFRVSMSLPSSVFKSTYWLWAAGYSGDRVICIDDKSRYQAYSNILTSSIMNQLDDPDRFLEWLAKRSRWQYGGGDTILTPMLKRWGDWEKLEGDLSAHRLDIVITDGQIHDYDSASETQSQRRFGHYRALLINLSGSVGYVPFGFTGYTIGVLDLQRVLRDELDTFVREI